MILHDTKYNIDFHFIYNVNEMHKIDENKGVLINLALTLSRRASSFSPVSPSFSPFSCSGGVFASFPHASSCFSSFFFSVIVFDVDFFSAHHQLLVASGHINF